MKLLPDWSSSRFRVLLTVLALVSGGTAWLYLRPGSPLEVVAVPANGTVHFSIRPKTRITSIRVVPDDRLALAVVDEDANPADPLAVWSVRLPSEEQVEAMRQRRERAGRPMRGDAGRGRVTGHFAYGRPWRLGLWPRPGQPRNPPPLEADRGYVLLLETDAGEAELRFSG